LAREGFSEIVIVMIDSLGIIGAGNMAEAIARAVLNARLIPPSHIIAADVSAQRRELFERELTIRCVASAADAARQATILLAVKPQHMESVLREIAPAVVREADVISIAAGITTSFIDRFLAPTNCRIVRAMPNTPMLVGEGAVAIAPGPRATGETLDRARKIFEPAAAVIEVSEDKLDAVTAVSGSGPAYFFFLVEQMIRAGVANGLSEAEATLLATRTAIGAGKMLAGTTDSPQELRRKVTSPGGTTQAAIEHMQAKGFEATIVDAITAATRRARELSGGGS
jgi:pyrroline-5-carboxylate reductase